MMQQIIALVIILYFVSRLLWQKKKKEITGAEFVFWLAFWLIAAAAVVLIKEIDRFVASMGFSSTMKAVWLAPSKAYLKPRFTRKASLMSE
jgi:hypothetical protein